MFPIGKLTEAMGNRYFREVKGCLGYIHLLHSPKGEYLDADYIIIIYYADYLCFQHPDRYVEEQINYLSVFTNTSNEVLNTDDMKH